MRENDTAMSEYERRQDDPRIGEIVETVKEIRTILQGENGLLVVVREIKTKSESCQKELTEHKSNHWQFSSIVIGIVGAIIAMFEWLKK